MLNKSKFEKVLERVINKNNNRCSVCKNRFLGLATHLAGWIQIARCRTSASAAEAI